ncbi:alpha/beta fold hydrolase [Nocardioides albus]|uniref:3-oxoadipate enol-lactonase/4-carboxymuconolactone decarboxylase n=1 Tax=Nocardioides albus TaxID=1841 RepID=A0A7W5FA66_9ACTN|nr:alpha/beta fold hydrolase [Nocardioides albus]MBB3090999.1 3-oxoadipate enol-lactonase/4-carboxymuconolactone decarboxylase [Nocardioides albus]GGU38893.1 3-oxoadipate enol-lactonase [Nocardioides albus]
MTPRITPVELAGDPSKPLLVVGPSLGTSVTALWSAAAELLEDSFHVIGWELPGHGHGTPTTDGFSMADLAAGVLASVDTVLTDRGERHGTFAYAGDSVGGAAGLQLLLDAPARVSAAVLTNTGAKIGEAEGWNDRAATVRKAGTASQIAGSTQRWFAPGFLEREPARGGALLHSLRDADAESYALVCGALAAYDVRGRLAEIAAPVLAIAGVDDAPTPPASLEEIAVGVRNGRLVSLDGVGHLAPAEAPNTVATLITSHVAAADPSYTAGMNVRRQVLGDPHVDRATAAITDVNRDYQDLITRYAWGTIWTRPGLARRDRSIAVLTALVAGRHFEELEFHLRAALTNGLTREEIIEVLLQTSIYVGVPAANSAFAVANRVLND